MKSLAFALVLSSVGLSSSGNVSTLSAGGSAQTSSNSAFTFSATAEKVLGKSGAYRYQGSLTLQTYVGHQFVSVLIPAWSQGTWAGNQATLTANATVNITRAGKTTVYHGLANVLFVDNHQGQNSSAPNPPPCDCVCLTWKDKNSNLSLDLLGSVQKGGIVRVK